MHFVPEEKTQEASYVDEETGHMVPTPLLSLCILPGIIPLEFPSCPAYFSKECTRRGSSDYKWKWLETAGIQAWPLQNQRKHLAVNKRQVQYNALQLIFQHQKQKVNFLALHWKSSSGGATIKTRSVLKALKPMPSGNRPHREATKQWRVVRFDGCKDGHSCEAAVTFLWKKLC